MSENEKKWLVPSESAYIISQVEKNWHDGIIVVSTSGIPLVSHKMDYCLRPLGVIETAEWFAKMYDGGYGNWSRELAIYLEPALLKKVIKCLLVKERYDVASYIVGTNRVIELSGFVKLDLDDYLAKYVEKEEEI